MQVAPARPSNDNEPNFLSGLYVLLCWRKATLHRTNNGISALDECNETNAARPLFVLPEARGSVGHTASTASVGPTCARGLGEGFVGVRGRWPIYTHSPITVLYYSPGSGSNDTEAKQA